MGWECGLGAECFLGQYNPGVLYPAGMVPLPLGGQM